MQTHKKLLALTVSLVLLGQNMAFALPPQTDTQDVDLAQYQQQARQAVEKAPWIKQNSKWLFGLGGVALGSAVTALVQQARRHALQKAQAQEIADFLGQEGARYMGDAKYMGFSRAASQRFWVNPFQKPTISAKQLALEKIYVPVYWKNVADEMPADSTEYRYAANILPLPCDQRYTPADMERVASAVLRLCGRTL